MSTPLSQALAALRRRHGDGVIRSGDTLEGVEAWPTGIPVLDHRLAPGGIPLGRLSLLAAAAPGVSGRLTLLQALTATASRERTAVYLDLTGSLDPGFLADLGADLSALLLVRPPSGLWADGLSMARSLVRAGAPWIAIALPEPRAALVPSGPPDHRLAGQAAVTPSAPQEPQDSTVAARARPAADPGWEHRLTGLVEAVAARRAVCLVAAADPPAALGYAASLTLECVAEGWHEIHGDVLGLRTRLTVARSKVSAPGETVTLLLRYPRPFATAEVMARPEVVDLRTEAAAGIPVAAVG
ncbi:MAG TPA: hypothetical protein VEK76_11155 [Candidatus Binatia bacterium]|nr:hypothetical protein [Candidatus Binatia bacterium]